MNTDVESGWLKRGYWGLAQGGNFLGHFLLIILRLYFGTMLIMTGVGKFMNASSVADYFGSLHIPYPHFTAYLTATIELMGGISLFLGLFSRIFSVILIVLFFVAYATAHHDALINFFTKPSLFIQQDPFLYLLTAFIVLCFGPGFISIDYWLEKRAYGRSL